MKHRLGPLTLGTCSKAQNFPLPQQAKLTPKIYPSAPRQQNQTRLRLTTRNQQSRPLPDSLHPILAKTARTTPADSVRVVGVSSNGAESLSPKGGVDLDNIDFEKVDRQVWVRYGTTKAGNIFPRQRVGKEAERWHHQSGRRGRHQANQKNKSANRHTNPESQSRWHQGDSPS